MDELFEKAKGEADSEAFIRNAFERCSSVRSSGAQRYKSEGAYSDR